MRAVVRAASRSQSEACSAGHGGSILVVVVVLSRTVLIGGARGVHDGTGLGAGRPARGHRGAGAGHRGTPRRALPDRAARLGALARLPLRWGTLAGLAGAAARRLRWRPADDGRFRRAAQRAVSAVAPQRGVRTVHCMRPGFAEPRASTCWWSGATTIRRQRPTPADPGRDASDVAGAPGRGTRAEWAGAAVRRAALPARCPAAGRPAARPRAWTPGIAAAIGARVTGFAAACWRQVRAARAAWPRMPWRTPSRLAAPACMGGRWRCQSLCRELLAWADVVVVTGRFRLDAVGSAGHRRAGLHRRPGRPWPAASPPARKPGSAPARRACWVTQLHPSRANGSTRRDASLPKSSARKLLPATRASVVTRSTGPA